MVRVVEFRIGRTFDEKMVEMKLPEMEGMEHIESTFEYGKYFKVKQSIEDQESYQEMDEVYSLTDSIDNYFGKLEGEGFNVPFISIELTDHLLSHYILYLDLKNIAGQQQWLKLSVEKPKVCS